MVLIMTVAERMIKNVKRLSLEDLKKAGDKAYDERVKREQSLLQAYDEKKLKSPKLIEEAKALKKKLDKKNKKVKTTEQLNIGEINFLEQVPNKSLFPMPRWLNGRASVL